MDRAARLAGPHPRFLAVGAGIAMSLIGMLGDLVMHIVSPDHHEELISFGSGANPWHFVLFAGIVLTAAAGAWMAFGLGSRAWQVGGGGLALLSAVVLVAGALAAIKAAREPNVLTEHVHAVAASSDTHEAHAGGTAASHEHHQTTSAEGASEFGHHHGRPGKVTAAQRVVLDRQLAAARAATAKYRDIDVAKAAGYFQVTQFIPGLGMHLANLGIPNFVFNPAKPQVLLYEPEGGRDVLVGVGYTFSHVNDVPPQGFAGGSDVWHFHRNLCFMGGGTVTITASKADCPGVFQQQTSWLLHAWIWKHNPRGVFTEKNPTVR